MFTIFEWINWSLQVCADDIPPQLPQGSKSQWKTHLICFHIQFYSLDLGFGLLEAGCVSRRNEVNILIKNAVDVVFGGVSYWIFGFGLSFGNEDGSNGFNGVGFFFVDSDDDTMGLLFSTYVFQLSFATTATTIVSGAMAERTKLISYIVFSFLNTIVYCIPAHWEWASDGKETEKKCYESFHISLFWLYFPQDYSFFVKPIQQRITR